jgi:BirA family transcriptional regulator, biotin operon repressor / biotin---[acetyl-CoA-carboxylase] ligase
LGPFGHLHYVTDIDSTNTAAMALAHGGAAEGTAVLAGAQRAGRGRLGRTWFSPPGAGLYLSVIVRPQAGAQGLALLTLAAGVAVAQAIEEATGLAIELKWPNDLVAGRPWRKLGGLLCEAAGSGAFVDAVVIGIGLNVRPSAYPPAIADRATSLEAELGRDVDRARLLVEILASIANATGRLWAGDRRWICDEWRRFARAGLGGAIANWTDHDARWRGAVRDIDDDGGLIVEINGQTRRLIAGEVIWERLSRG